MVYVSLGYRVQEALALSFIAFGVSSAGGPILVMPILVVLGFRIREVIAIALFDSIFIAIPSSVGYLL